MSARAWNSNSRTSAYGFAGEGEYSADWELAPGERVCPPFARSRSKAGLRGILFLLIVLGGSWVLLRDRETWSQWLQIASAAVFPATESARPEPGEQMAMPAPGPSLAELSPRADLELPASVFPPEPAGKPTPLPKATIPAEAPPAAAVSDAELGADGSANAPLPPPTADPDDPYETRALAVGLHPGLSRVLLTQLSATDYRNAGIAIRKAMAETLDSGAFIWPRQRKPELALFRVHFVPGAAPNCRRYVVTVAKNGWSTTALPMEKCGPEVSRGRS